MTKETIMDALNRCEPYAIPDCCAGCPYNDCWDTKEECITKLHSDAHTLLKAQEPRVMTLEEVEHLTYGSPYIIETNLPKEEPRLMYGLFSHLGLQGNFSFAFTDGRGYLFDVDYGKRWRCWTSRPDEKVRADTPWE